MTSSDEPHRQGATPQTGLGHQRAATAALKVEDLRTVLSHLSTPHRLDTPQIRALLAHHRRLRSTLSPTAVGAAAAKLLTDKIASLDPGPEAPGPERLPYLVLETCFLRGRKNFQAAAELGLSERQITRERERALRLLTAELAAPISPGLEPEPIPPIDGHIRRDELLRRLSEGAATQRFVCVVGERGAGKTSLVAALAHALGPDSVWWHRIRPGINDSLEAVLFELGRALASEGATGLRDYLAAALPHLDVGVATRLALDDLAGKRRLLAFDDFGSAGEPRPITGWLEEAVERVPLVSVITIGSAIAGAMVVKVRPLSTAETAQLFGDLDVDDEVAGVHELSGGNIRMLSSVAAWWRGDEHARRALERHLKGRGPLANLVDLMAFTHRGAA